MDNRLYKLNIKTPYEESRSIYNFKDLLKSPQDSDRRVYFIKSIFNNRTDGSDDSFIRIELSKFDTNYLYLTGKHNSLQDGRKQVNIRFSDSIDNLFVVLEDVYHKPHISEIIVEEFRNNTSPGHNNTGIYIASEGVTYREIDFLEIGKNKSFELYDMCNKLKYPSEIEADILIPEIIKRVIDIVYPSDLDLSFNKMSERESKIIIMESKIIRE